jgi:hypothetical protein
MKAIVCGGRAFNNVDVLWEVLDKYDPDFVIQGGAYGADFVAKDWAKRHNKGVIEHKADWDQYGRGAGPIRNAKMLTEKPDIVIAFPGGKGTENMITQAKEHGFEVRKIKITWEAIDV